MNIKKISWPSKIVQPKSVGPAVWPPAAEKVMQAVA